MHLQGSIFQSLRHITWSLCFIMFKSFGPPETCMGLTVEGAEAREVTYDFQLLDFL